MDREPRRQQLTLFDRYRSIHDTLFDDDLSPGELDDLRRRFDVVDEEIGESSNQAANRAPLLRQPPMPAALPHQSLPTSYTPLLPAYLYRPNQAPLPPSPIFQNPTHFAPSPVPAEAYNLLYRPISGAVPSPSYTRPSRPPAYLYRPISGAVPSPSYTRPSLPPADLYRPISTPFPSPIPPTPSDPVPADYRPISASPNPSTPSLLPPVHMDPSMPAAAFANSYTPWLCPTGTLFIPNNFSGPALPVYVCYWRPAVLLAYPHPPWPSNLHHPHMSAAAAAAAVTRHHPQLHPGDPRPHSPRH